MITLDQYIGTHKDSPDLTPERIKNANNLLESVNALMANAEADNIEFLINPATGSQISGKTFGGFRPQNCPQGAPKSNHKQGKGIDLYDPHGQIDAWCMANFSQLEDAGIWIEHPEATTGWSHWQSVPPKSGKRAYHP